MPFRLCFFSVWRITSLQRCLIFTPPPPAFPLFWSILEMWVASFPLSEMIISRSSPCRLHPLFFLLANVSQSNRSGYPRAFFFRPFPAVQALQTPSPPNLLSPDMRRCRSSIYVSWFPSATLLLSTLLLLFYRPPFKPPTYYISFGQSQNNVPAFSSFKCFPPLHFLPPFLPCLIDLTAASYFSRKKTCFAPVSALLIILLLSFFPCLYHDDLARSFPTPLSPAFD